MFGDDISYKFKDSSTSAAATIDFECDYDENVKEDGTHPFTFPPLFSQWGNKSTLLCDSPLCRGHHRR